MAHHFDGNQYVGEHMGVKYTLPTDGTPENPRKECDGWLGIMACEHRRYNLGDKDGTNALCDEIRNSKYYRDSWENEESRFYKGDASGPKGISKMLPFCKDIIYLPLYLYDHSGITMSTSQFSCPWDSGQVGFIFCTKTKVLEQFGAKAIWPLLRRKVLDILEAEVKVYDHYLRGDVYGFEVGDDSVWGFYGDEDAASAAEEHISGLSDEERNALIAEQSQPDEDDDDA